MSEAGMSPGGLLIVNADDWGRDRRTTDLTLDCILAGSVSSVSAMVFMEDSERAATIALGRGVDTGLHLNFTTKFSSVARTPLIEHQLRLAAFLQSHHLAKVLFHPGLVRSFDYVVSAQLEEFANLYGAPPRRLDGHHHMHLCANVVFRELIPAGTVVRRNCSFVSGEKSILNRRYRRFLDTRLAKRHRLVDYLFNLQPLVPPMRLRQIAILSQRSVVELEAHPIRSDEYRFLRGGDIFRLADNVKPRSPEPWYEREALG